MLSKAVQYYLKELKRSYPVEEWITDTRLQISQKTGYTLRSSNRHLLALYEEGLVDHRRQSTNPGRAEWKIRNTL